MEPLQDLNWRPGRLACERMTGRVLVTSTHPTLSWRLPDVAEGPATAFQVRVATSVSALEGEPDLWDSGWLSGDTPRCRYAGAPLRSRAGAFWTVRVRTRSTTSDWAEPGVFEVGLLERSDWTASWISRPPAPGTPPRAAYLLRCRFLLDGPTTRACAYVSALGTYRLALNGESVGEGLLRPGWTDTRLRVPYERVELGGALRIGENVFAAEIAPGWYAGRISSHVSPDSAVPVPIPEFIAQIEIVTGDGRHITVTSDESWEWAASPILASDLYDGEDWDLRLRDAAWAEIGSALAWEPVERSHGTAGALVGARTGPLRITEQTPVTITARGDKTLLADSGCNDTGYLSLTIRGVPAGRRIEVAYGEILDAAGNLYRDNLRSARCVDTFVTSGAPQETLAPAFSFRGYRFAEIRGLGSENLIAADAMSLGSDLARSGWFSSGARVLEEIYEMMLCSLRANYLEVPTDCPQRDERMGWLADALLFAPVAAYTFDISSFMAKWFDDILDARTPTGRFPDIAPRPSARWPERSFEPGAPGWGDAGILLPWLMFERYGDADVLAQMFPAMLAHLDAVHADNPDGVWRHGRGKDYGDWVPAGPDTSHDLFSTCWLYRSTAVAAEIAGLVGDQQSANRLTARAAQVRNAFHQHFVTADGRVRDPHPTGSPAASRFAPLVAEETQTGYVMALAFDLLEADLAAQAGARLQKLFRASGGQLETGFCGSAFLPAALERAGAADVAYDLLLREQPPSLGFMARQGATSVWERWDGLDAQGRPACPTMNSFNHYAMSSMLSWLVEGVCGLRPVPGVPALREIAFAPTISRRVPSAQFRFDAPAGRVELGWTWAGDRRVTGQLLLPPGMQATVASTLALDGAPGAARRIGKDGVPARDKEILVGPVQREFGWEIA